MVAGTITSFLLPLKYFSNIHPYGYLRYPIPAQNSVLDVDSYAASHPVQQIWWIQWMWCCLYVITNSYWTQKIWIEKCIQSIIRHTRTPPQFRAAMTPSLCPLEKRYLNLALVPLYISISVICIVINKLDMRRRRISKTGDHTVMTVHVFYLRNDHGNKIRLQIPIGLL